VTVLMGGERAAKAVGRRLGTGRVKRGTLAVSVLGEDVLGRGRWVSPQWAAG